MVYLCNLVHGVEYTTFEFNFYRKLRQKVLQSKAGYVRIQKLCFLRQQAVKSIRRALCRPCHIMVDVAQLVRASDCGSEGRGFESLHPPQNSDL